MRKAAHGGREDRDVFRNLCAFALLVAMLLGACSRDQRPAEAPVPPDSGGGDTVSPPWNVYASYYYVGPFSGSLLATKEVTIDFRGCDGLVVSGGACIDLWVDGGDQIINAIQPGAIIEFLSDPSQGTPRVDLQHAAIGLVEAIDPAHARFTVLGQTVYVTDRTAQSGTGLQAGSAILVDLAVGDSVAVSGYFSTDGSIVATQVERGVEPGPVLLRGVLASDTDGAFRIGALRLNLSGASLDGFPGGAPLAGDSVLLFADQGPQNGTLAVRLVRYATKDYQPAAQEVLTGFVTTVRENWDFDIGGHGFWTYACDECDALMDAGKQVASGTFVTATKDASNVAHLSLGWTTGDTTGLTGTVEAVDTTTDSVTVLGFHVQTSPATYVSIDAIPWVGSDTLNLAALAIGDTITVRGGLSGRIIVADRLAPAESSARIRTTKFVLADPAIVFLGRSIQTDGSTVVVNCQLYTDVCTASDVASLFDSTAQRPSMLIIDVTPAGDEVRATKIEAIYS